MKHAFGMKKTVLAAAVAAGMIMPGMAAAEISGSLGISNMYFWRGQDISNGAAQVFGSLDYSHSSGLYAGVWGSSKTDSTEYDLYVGYGGAFGDLTYDLSYIDYNYPNDTDSDLAEIVASLGYAGVTFTGYFGVGDYGHGSDATDNKDRYYTLGYSYDKYGILVGTWDNDADDTNYTHLDLSYALTDNLSFTVSKVISADDCAINNNDDALFMNGECVGDKDDVDDDLLFVVSYAFEI
ncbi:TorF family putative porin [Alloalcanivorax xenomutans]|uniref:TorF family putative porin n=1 Tax=Alloalcanivorax xenomutans TaxID=1094342 RepID=UPI003BA9AB99